MNTNVKDRLRCAYEDCAEAHPMANESTYEQVTCPTCRAALGLPPVEIYENSGATVAATPKPRAGEYTKGPWTANFTRYDGGVEGFHIAGFERGSSYEICGFVLQKGDSSAEAEANARRIVACVNYCEGMPTEQLERSTIGHQGLQAERDLLREREKALVEALEIICGTERGAEEMRKVAQLMLSKISTKHGR